MWEQTHELPGREGGQAQLLVNLQLFFSPWETLSAPLASKQESSFDPVPFFADAASAIEKIRVHYIDELTDQQPAIHNHQELDIPYYCYRAINYAKAPNS